MVSSWKAFWMKTWMLERQVTLKCGERLGLTNFVTSLPMFMLYFLEIPRVVWKNSRFLHIVVFLASDVNKLKYRLTKNNMVCRQKNEAGLIEVLILKNRCLLSKWLMKLLIKQGCGKSCYTVNIFGINATTSIGKAYRFSFFEGPYAG